MPEYAVYIFYTRRDTKLYGARMDNLWDLRQEVPVSEGGGWVGDLAFSDSYLYRLHEGVLTRAHVDHLNRPGASEPVYSDLPHDAKFAVSGDFLYYVSGRELHIRRFGQSGDYTVPHDRGQWNGKIAAAAGYMYRIDGNACLVYRINGTDVSALGHNGRPRAGEISLWDPLAPNGVLYRSEQNQLMGNTVDGVRVAQEDRRIDGPDRERWNSSIAVAAFREPGDPQAQHGPGGTPGGSIPPDQQPVAIADFTIDPGEIQAEQQTAFRVTLSKPSGQGGATVVFQHITNTGLDDTLVNVPTSITIQAGSTEGSITVQTRRATEEATDIVWTAFIGSANHGSRSANLTVR